MGRDLEKNLKTIYSDHSWSYNVEKVRLTYHDCGGTWFYAGIYIKPTDEEWFWTAETEMKLKKGLQDFYTVREMWMEPEKKYVFVKLDYRKEILDDLKRKKEMRKSLEKKVKEKVEEILKNLYSELKWPNNIWKIEASVSIENVMVAIKMKHWSENFWTKENINELRKALENYCDIECIQSILQREINVYFQIKNIEKI